MFRASILVGLFLVGFVGLGQDCFAASASQVKRWQADADRYYEQQRYQQAERLYRKLAEAGDKFSQYRLSMMYLEGVGLPRNSAESFAWAYVAAENNHNAQLSQVRDRIYSSLPETQRGHAANRAKDLVKQFGDAAVAQTLRKNIKEKRRDCTGSRLGATCHQLTLTGLPRNISTSGGGGGFGASNDGTSTSSAGSAATGGSPHNTAAHYLKTQESLRQLEVYIAQNSGEVELRDLELKD